jgi:hypothetical protein
MHGYYRVELFQIGVSDGSERGRSSGVAHKAIESAKAAHGLVDHRIDVGLDGDVCSYEDRSVAKPPRKLLSSFTSSAGDHDLTAGGNENLGSASSDPAGCARYDRDFP